ncbi:MAG TPA: carbon storage regulator [Bryobacteraceae bacterium]|nr:carbon storage regulator [Bryobacteraceae bacterium]
MLVMRRRAGESFLLGDDIEIQVLQVSGTRVKLGIVAPSSVAIVRREVQITRNENQSAAHSVTPRAIESLLQVLPPLAAPLSVTTQRQDFDESNNQSLTSQNHA